MLYFRKKGEDRSNQAIGMKVRNCHVKQLLTSSDGLQRHLKLHGMFAQLVCGVAWRPKASDQSSHLLCDDVPVTTKITPDL